MLLEWWTWSVAAQKEKVARHTTYTFPELDCFMMWPMDMVSFPNIVSPKMIFTYTGEISPKIYHDVDDITEITTLPLEGHLHRDIDIVVLNTGLELKVPTAIISPPMIYGIGAGPIKSRSIQVPILTEAILKRGHGFQILNGQNIWDRRSTDTVSPNSLTRADSIWNKISI